MADGDLLVRGIGRLLTMANGVVDGPAAVVIRDGRVAWTGREAELPGQRELPSYDADGAAVVPGFVDPHTHLVWAGSRREEFVARLAGQPYDGGGIRTTVAATRTASADELVGLALSRVRAMQANGTTTVEAKTGYGLSADDELRLLDVLRAVAERTPVQIELTYLGAHVVPAGRERSAYVDEVVATLPAAAEHGAQWCDVFCDVGAFDIEETRRILAAARDAGLGLRLHAEQLARTGAAALAAEVGCASADHLERITEDDARALAEAGVVGVLLPTAALSVRDPHREHVDRLRRAGVRLALATDCNPGTSWCESMPFAIQVGCLEFGLTVAEAFAAATSGGAAALRRTDIGQVAIGARGDLAVLAAEHEADLVAHLGARPVSVTVIGGVPWLADA
ncbi:MAG: imidazolonepropionase [Actinomycetes bacterium]